MESNCAPNEDAIATIVTNIQVEYEVLRKLMENTAFTEDKRYRIKSMLISCMQLKEMQLTDTLATTSEEENWSCIIGLAVVHMNLGIVYSKTDKIKLGEEHLMKCVNLLKDKELEPSAVLLVLGALNQLGPIWFQWNEPTKARDFLVQAEKIYNEFTSIPGRVPFNMPHNFGIEGVNIKEHPREKLEKLNTFTLYYLAQVYKSLQDLGKSVMYCHMTLRSQLGHNYIMQDLNHIDWALNAANLSKYFTDNDGFSQARHHLAAASYILQRYEDILKRRTENNEESEELAADWENFKHKSADIARCWAKYGIQLLYLSKQRFLQDDESEQENDESDDDSPKSEILNNLKFNILKEKIEPIENQITDKYLLDFDDAKLVFLNLQKWLGEAKLYYTLENHASMYISIVQDISKGYKYLLFFEKHGDRQAKMHKRRIDMLENVIKEVNPQYYKAACRQIWIELAEAYSDILYIKLDRLLTDDIVPRQQLVPKINRLTKNSIKNYQAFLDSLKTRNSDSVIEQIPDEMLQTALSSYSHIGRLYNKLITFDKAVQQDNIQNSINAFKFVVDYCEKYPEAAEIMKVELKICKEFVNLLPMKGNWLQNEMKKE
ncbi:KIF1-binding protein like protein [Habropoda laboriosa]|uniref:KIF-binding protein n=1 Tax=Habropoda laboriosa TaxID=597456 RepID=A0A0L7R3M2_9HYME|nr:PREDICTED: KIF1-binding protein homolog [Habropoda laboriosa]KOC65351.1 KIF1-binding protein like protein [Habropoda laboriosa]